MDSERTTCDVGYQRFDQVFERFSYPAGESHVQLHENLDLMKLRVIEAHARTFDDLAQIVTADRILRRLGAQVRWFVPYFPFARHDRRNSSGDGFELQLALELVQELDLVIADPHSEVAAQLAHVTQSDCVALMRGYGAFDTDPVVIIPDAGAAKKAWDWIETTDVVQAHKQRDAASGALSGFTLPVSDLAGRPCIIVDDICDAGGTFLGLANKLNAANAGPLILGVTHGIFSKGVEVLLDEFAEVYCFGDEARLANCSVTQIPFSQLYAGGTIR